MKPQLSQDYNVDARYVGGRNSVDNNVGKAFVSRYISRMREEKKPEITADRREDNRFVIDGPGSTSYTFKNGFRAKQ
jgi:hypothetical protein